MSSQTASCAVSRNAAALQSASQPCHLRQVASGACPFGFLLVIPRTCTCTCSGQPRAPHCDLRLARERPRHSCSRTDSFILLLAGVSAGWPGRVCWEAAWPRSGLPHMDAHQDGSPTERCDTGRRPSSYLTAAFAVVRTHSQAPDINLRTYTLVSVSVTWRAVAPFHCTAPLMQPPQHGG